MPLAQNLKIAAQVLGLSRPKTDGLPASIYFKLMQATSFCHLLRNHLESPINLGECDGSDNYPN